MTPDRLRPRIWRTDWLILRQLARKISAACQWKLVSG